MLSREDNERLTRVGRGSPMGELMRRYWIPAGFSHQIAAPDSPPARVKLLGERLVMFRDTQGRVGLLGEQCPHRTASLFFGRNEECGLRCVYHGWKFDIDGNCVDLPSEPRDYNCRAASSHGLPVRRARRPGVGLFGAARAKAGISGA
jgi:phthalate 4,5-dioxygenase oxygenase subunit